MGQFFCTNRRGIPQIQLYQSTNLRRFRLRIDPNCPWLQPRFNYPNYAATPQQTLAEALAEIQALLQQLEQTNPTATEADQKAFVNVAIPPTKRDRILGAAQGAGLAILEETQYGKIIKGIIEGWQKPGE